MSFFQVSGQQSEKWSPDKRTSCYPVCLASDQGPKISQNVLLNGDLCTSAASSMSTQARIKTTWALMFDCALRKSVFGGGCCVVTSLRCCLQIAWVLRGCYGFLCFQWPAESNCHLKSRRTSTPLSYSERCGRLFLRRFGLSSRFLLVHRLNKWFGFETLKSSIQLRSSMCIVALIAKFTGIAARTGNTWPPGCRNRAANRMARAISTTFSAMPSTASPCAALNVKIRFWWKWCRMQLRNQKCFLENSIS